MSALVAFTVVTPFERVEEVRGFVVGARRVVEWTVVVGVGGADVGVLLPRDHEDGTVVVRGGKDRRGGVAARAPTAT